MCLHTFFDKYQLFLDNTTLDATLLEQFNVHRKIRINKVVKNEQGKHKMYHRFNYLVLFLLTKYAMQ